MENKKKHVHLEAQSDRTKYKKKLFNQFFKWKSTKANGHIHDNGIFTRRVIDFYKNYANTEDLNLRHQKLF